MTEQQFEDLVREAFRSIPVDFRARLQDVAIVVEQEPAPQVLQDLGIEPPDTLFGLYHGIPLTERGWQFGNQLPDRIVIYRGPIEDACEDEDEIYATVAETLIHEAGHFFGLSEEEIEEIEERYWRGDDACQPESS
jgi:predicted Zn-dependent protease with MMP-like domain